MVSVRAAGSARIVGDMGHLGSRSGRWHGGLGEPATASASGSRANHDRRLRSAVRRRSSRGRIGLSNRGSAYGSQPAALADLVERPQPEPGVELVVLAALVEVAAASSRGSAPTTSGPYRRPRSRVSAWPIRSSFGWTVPSQNITRAPNQMSAPRPMFSTMPGDRRRHAEHGEDLVARHPRRVQEVHLGRASASTATPSTPAPAPAAGASSRRPPNFACELLLQPRHRLVGERLVGLQHHPRPRAGEERLVAATSAARCWRPPSGRWPAAATGRSAGRAGSGTSGG